MPAGYDAEVAELFRDFRAASGLSEADLAAQLATRLDVIQALENGALYALPSWTETCRVVTAYGMLLNLDVRPLLQRIYAQVEGGAPGPAPRPQPDRPFMPQSQNGARPPGNQWSSAPFNQAAPSKAPPPGRSPSPFGLDNSAGNQPRRERAAPFSPPFNEPVPNQPRHEKASPFGLPFDEPAQSEQPPQRPSPFEPFQAPKGSAPPLGRWGGAPATQQPRNAPSSPPLSQPSFKSEAKPAPFSQPSFAQEAKQKPSPFSRPGLPTESKPVAQPSLDLVSKAAARAKAKTTAATASSKEKSKPRRGLLKWGIAALIASAAVLGLWIVLSKPGLLGMPGSKPVEQGATQEQGPPPPPAQDGPDPRSRKADRLPSP
jgi:hypothetical protein